MNTLTRVLALCAVCSSAVSFAGPPLSAPYGEKLSCVPAAQPFFNRAWDALANVRLDEARDLFTQTVAVDPACTLAWGYLGSLTPGANGRRMLEDAGAASALITEPERLQIMALAAQHRGDHEQALSLMRSALVYDPTSYHLSFLVAQRAGVLRQWEEMASAALKATELSPSRGEGWNLLGYGYVGLKQYELAVAAFRHYAEVAPLEPNAHDSLGDALLASGKLDQAKAAYQRALDASEGSFWASNHGVATVCALQGDWFCARAAIEKARRTAPQLDDRLKLMEWTAWSYLADDQPGEAYRAIDELELDARRTAKEAHVAEAQLLRARFFLTQSRLRDALSRLQVLGTQRYPTLNEGEKLSIETRRLHAMVEAQARLGSLAEAQKTLQQLRKLYGARPHDVKGSDAIAHAQGLIALQRREPAAALAAFGKCSDAFAACQLHLSDAQELAGDAAGSRRTRALVRAANLRDPEYWWVRVKALEQPAGSEARAKPEDRSAW